MKKTRCLAHTFLVFVGVLFFKTAFSQGRVVINEFMPWSGCSTNSEFIELLNFGPGPMDIGCYIITNGTYSVTIPPNTIIQPREYFVIAGQNTLAQYCGNVDSTVQVDLNWSVCNCTNVPIPSTGDGFMKDGGGANEKIILLDPDLNIIDAVSRDVPESPSNSITTPAVDNCSSRTFHPGTMAVSYETINKSTGVDNSFARKVDGDCGWVKTTAISAGAPNKTGSSASASYEFSTVDASDCQSTQGSVSIQVNAPDVSSLFPMHFTLAYDADSNGIFNSSDMYLGGTDSVYPNIDINNLAYGRYRITVGSSSSCNLRSFDFFIFNCYGVVLPVKLRSFHFAGTSGNTHRFKYQLEEPQHLKELALEYGDGNRFYTAATKTAGFIANTGSVSAQVNGYRLFRLRLTDHFGKITYSQVINLPTESLPSANCWPLPAKDKIYIRLNQFRAADILATLYDAKGEKLKQFNFQLSTPNESLEIPVSGLPAGWYFVTITAPAHPPLHIRFIK